MEKMFSITSQKFTPHNRSVAMIKAGLSWVEQAEGEKARAAAI